MKLLPNQLPPTGDWNIWIHLGDRGAGKTVAGAAWLAAVEKNGYVLGIGPRRSHVTQVMRPAFSAFAHEAGSVSFVHASLDPHTVLGLRPDRVWYDEPLSGSIVSVGSGVRPTLFGFDALVRSHNTRCVVTQSLDQDFPEWFVRLMFEPYTVVTRPITADSRRVTRTTPEIL